VTPLPNQSPRLTYDVFALKRPGLTRDVPPGTESLQWVANTATLIAGSQDAVLGDTFTGLPHIKCVCLLLNHWQIVLH
jgi:hypothetical protein